MNGAGIQPDVITHSALPSACEKADGLEAAQAACAERKGVGTQPTVITYSAMLSACEKAHDLEAAQAVCAEMKVVGINTYSTSSQAFCAAAALTPAENAFSAVWGCCSDSWKGATKLSKPKPLRWQPLRCSTVQHVQYVQYSKYSKQNDSLLQHSTGVSYSAVLHNTALAKMSRDSCKDSTLQYVLYST